MKAVVVGLGEFGMALAQALSRNGAEVIAVDRNMDLVTEIKDQVDLAICLDVTLPNAFEGHGFETADVMVGAIGENFEAEVLTIVNAKTLGIPKIVGRGITPAHSKVLRAVGADTVLNPEKTAAHRAAQRLLIPDLQGYFELAEGFSIVEVPAPAGCVGKTLRELDLRNEYRVNLVAIKRWAGEGGFLEDFNPVPLPSNQIQEQDVLALVGSDKDITRFLTEHTPKEEE